MLRTRLLLALLVALASLLAACGGDDEADDADDGIVIGQSTDSDSDDSDSDDSDSDDEDDGGSDDDDSAGGGGDLQVVWPLPDGDFDVWLPYQLIDDEFHYSESASFQAMDVTMDDVLAFYRDYFPTIGLIPNELELGESVAMNLTNPDDPLWTGVMQTGVDNQGYVTVNQNYSAPKEGYGDGGSDDDPATSDGAADSSTEGSSSDDG